MNKVFHLIYITLCLSSIHSFSQATFDKPEVGKPMPYFEFANVKNYHKGKVTLDDFKGKWLLLNIWSVGCVGSVKNVTELYDLKRNTLDFEFLLVGANHNQYKVTEKFYDELNSRMSNSIPSAFDTLIWDKWKIDSVPYIYIIDPQGILRYITFNDGLTSEKLNALVNGEKVELFQLEEAYTLFKERHLFNMANENLLTTSMLMKWNGEKFYSGFDIDRFVNFKLEYKKEGWIVIGTPLAALYNFAYWGRRDWMYYDTAFLENIYPTPILEISDASRFQTDFTMREKTGLQQSGYYNYYLKAPIEKMSQDFIMEDLQKSLYESFGYRVSIENRKMPVWELIAKPTAGKHLKTKGGDPVRNDGSNVLGFSLNNHSVSQFLAALTTYQLEMRKLPILNETGIKHNIDISINGLLTDLSDIKRELKKNGLDLIRSTKEMKVLVIRDPLPN